MKGIRKTFALLVLLLGISPGLWAQANLTLIPITGDGLVPDTVSIGDSLLYEFYIKNTGNDSLSGAFSIRRSVNGNVAIIDSITTMGVLLPGDSIFLSPVTAKEQVLSQDYNAGGGNVVLVWPALHPQLGTSDTTVAEVYVLGETYISEGIELQVRAFPNPARQSLYLRLEHNTREIHSTEIYDLQGKNIRSYPGLRDELYLGDLPKGMYLLRLKLDQGHHWEQKILIQ